MKTYAPALVVRAYCKPTLSEKKEGSFVWLSLCVIVFPFSTLTLFPCVCPAFYNVLYRDRLGDHISQHVVCLLVGFSQ